MDGIDKFIKTQKQFAENDRLKNKTEVFPRSKPQEKKKGLVLTKKILWSMFKEEVGKNYVLDKSNENVIFTIFKYFLKDENFNSDGLISNKAGLEKGLLIWGDNGVGKTMLFEALHSIGFKLTKFGCYDLWFRMISSKSFVKDYMESTKSNESNFILKSYYTGNLYIDDLGLEGKAFATEELLGTLLFERDKKSGVTFVTTNKKPSEIFDRYGPAIGDRAKQMFNIIKWKGESFRN